MAYLQSAFCATIITISLTAGLYVITLVILGHRSTINFVPVVLRDTRKNDPGKKAGLGLFPSEARRVDKNGIFGGNER